MNIIIAGAGKVGRNLAESLSRDEKNAVILIDKDEESMREVSEILDIKTVCGSAVSVETLLNAGVADTDVVIATAANDELNMVCCLTAKKLGAKHTVARIRDSEYADELSRLKSALDLDLIINPEMAVAGEIARLLRFLTAVRVEIFARGKVEMAELRITEDVTVRDTPLENITHRMTMSIIIGAIERDGAIIIPKGQDKILLGDILYVFGTPSKVLSFALDIGLQIPKLKTAMIAGGGRIAYYLAKYLLDIDVRVKIIEKDNERSEELAALLPDSLIINGDGGDKRLLASEHVGEAGCFVALTGMDEENLIMSLLAKKLGTKKVVAKINRAGYADIIDEMNIDNIVWPQNVTADHILTFVRGLKNAGGKKIDALHRIIDDKAEVVEFKALKSSIVLDTPLKKMQILKGVLITAIVRKSEVIIPHGNDCILEGDRVILITNGLILNDLDEIIKP